MTRPPTADVPTRKRRVSKYGPPPPTDEDLKRAGRSLSSGRTEAQQRADLRKFDGEIERAIALAARRAKGKPAVKELARA